MHEEGVDEVPRLVATSQREHLVHGEIHGVEKKASEWLPDQGHEAPRRVVCPVDSCGSLVTTHDGPDEARDVEPHIDLVSGCVQPFTVVLESTRHSGDRVVKEVQVLADAEGVRQPVKGCSACQIALVSRRRGGQFRKQLSLKIG